VGLTEVIDVIGRGVRTLRH